MSYTAPNRKQRLHTDRKNKKQRCGPMISYINGDKNHVFFPLVIEIH